MNDTFPQPNMKLVDDSSIMPFGKYKGTALEKIPEAYLVWLWNDTDLRDALRDDTDRGALARYVKLAVIGNKEP
jgi:uncharacterized protein (DUF3820 family)